jgi:hypothetical protein
VSPPNVSFAKGAAEDLAIYLKERHNSVTLREAILAQAQLLSANPKLGRQHHGPGSLRYHVFQVHDGKKAYIVRLTYEILSDSEIIVLGCGPAAI